MTNTPDNIRNMWEEAAKRNLDEGNPYRSQQSPGMGSGIGPLTAGAREQLRTQVGRTEITRMQNNANSQGRALTADEQNAIETHRARNKNNANVSPAAQTSDAGAIGPQGPQGAAGAGGAVGRTKKKD